MPATTSATYRYQLPRKAIKADCPDCGPKHRKTLSRYVDTQTDEPLPEGYGRCDRESNCGYHLSPYHKGASGQSYADAVYERWKQDQPDRSNRPSAQRATRRVDNPVSRSTASVAAGDDQPIVSIPETVFRPSLGHYERNQFASLLGQHFGLSVATDLLKRFQIGTSGRWPGATVFWYIDEQDRKRGGQIKLFGDDWHTVKYTDREGRTRPKVDWVHTALTRRYDQQAQARPDWLTAYVEQGDFSPCLFGLPQLRTAPVDQPVAIVEAPKTAVVCTPYFPGFVWLATGSLSYLNEKRLAPLRGRTIQLHPDLSEEGSAFSRWARVADQLNQRGFQISMSRLLEDNASEQQREDGADLADYLLKKWKGYPVDWDSSDVCNPGPTTARPVLATQTALSTH